MPFKPGRSGNPGGRPRGATNKATRDIKQWCQKFLASPEYVDSARERVLAGEAPHLETLWHHYGFGKPKDVIKHEGEMPAFTVIYKDDVTD